MADVKKNNTAKNREELRKQRREADTRGLFAAYGDFGKGKKQSQKPSKKK